MQKQIDTLVEQLKQYQISAQKNAKTFLEIIKKSDREVYITEILAYLLNPYSNNDSLLCIRLFLETLGYALDVADEITITTNKHANGNYIDLFIEIKNKLVVVVENKIWAWEHGHNGDQTECYYQYCEKIYRNVIRKYVLLKPYNNLMFPKCNEIHGNIYQIITYSQLVENVLKKVCSKKGNNISYQRIIEDFIVHCRRFDMKQKLIDIETKIYLDNFDAIKELQMQYTQKLNHIKASVTSYMDKLGYAVNRGDAGKTYRFYKKNDSLWWISKNHYLYFEVIFNDDNINNVVCQVTLENKQTKNGKDDTGSFFQILEAIEMKYHTELVSDYWYVLSKNLISYCENDSIDDFIKRITDKLQELSVFATQVTDIIKSIIKV